ncbi:MAG: hypothetical protein JSU92_04885 [Deltaproteobacteria bacterium]|nr:MAG: hypothetical protein JSU92_04885 [Deltaproteobacteria bacterium]
MEVILHIKTKFSQRINIGKIAAYGLTFSLVFSTVCYFGCGEEDVKTGTIVGYARYDATDYCVDYDCSSAFGYFIIEITNGTKNFIKTNRADLFNSDDYISDYLEFRLDYLEVGTYTISIGGQFNLGSPPNKCSFEPIEISTIGDSPLNVIPDKEIYLSPVTLVIRLDTCLNF